MAADAPSPGHRLKAVWGFIAGLAAAVVATIGFITSDKFQYFVCHWGVVISVEDRYPDQVRWVCFKPASWTATPDEITETVDAYLAAASFDPVAAKRQFFTARAVVGEKGLAPSGTTRSPVIWSQRIGEITDRKRGYASFDYEWWQASEPEPARGLHRARHVRVGLKFEDEQQARFDSWGNEGFVSDINNERVDDGSQAFFRGEVQRRTTFKTLPDPKAANKTVAKVGDTVRVICHVDVPDRNWLRTTDGFLPSHAVRLTDDTISKVVACEPQHAQRAAARFGASPAPSAAPS